MNRALYCTRYFFFQAEDGIRDLVRSRGLGDVYKRQGDNRDGEGGARRHGRRHRHARLDGRRHAHVGESQDRQDVQPVSYTHLTLPTSDLV